MELINRSNKREESAAKEIVRMLLMAGLILFGTHSSIFSLVAFVLGCFIIVTESQIKSLEMLMFLAPMATIFKLSPNSLAFLTYLELFYVLFYFIRGRGKIEKSEMLIFLFGFYLLTIQIINGGIDLNATLKMLANLFLLSVAIKTEVEGEAKRLFIIFILGVIISSLMANITSSYFHITQFVGMKGYGTGAGGYVYRFSGLYRDPNYYSVNVIIALCSIILLLKRKKISALAAGFFSILLIAFAVETVSKSAIIMLAVPAIMFLYSMLRERRYGLFSIGVIAVAIILMLAFSNQIPALDNIMRRFMSAGTDLDSLTTHRSTLWQNYLHYLSDHIGALLFGRSLLNYTLNGAAPHNTYLDLLYQLGIVGSTFLFAVLALMFKKQRVNFNRNILNYSIAICIAIMYLFLSELQYYDLPFHFILCYFALNLKTEDEGESYEYALLDF